MVICYMPRYFWGNVLLSLSEFFYHCEAWSYRIGHGMLETFDTGKKRKINLTRWNGERWE